MQSLTSTGKHKQTQTQASANTSKLKRANPNTSEHKHTHANANASKRKYLYKSEQTKMLAAQKQLVEQRQQQQRDGRSTIRVATGLGTTKVMQVVETAVAFGDGDAIAVVFFLWLFNSLFYYHELSCHKHANEPAGQQTNRANKTNKYETLSQAKSQNQSRSQSQSSSLLSKFVGGKPQQLHHRLLDLLWAWLSLLRQLSLVLQF